MVSRKLLREKLIRIQMCCKKLLDNRRKYCKLNNVRGTYPFKLLSQTYNSDDGRTE